MDIPNIEVAEIPVVERIALDACLVSELTGSRNEAVALGNHTQNTEPGTSLTISVDIP